MLVFRGVTFPRGNVAFGGVPLDSYMITRWKWRLQTCRYCGGKSPRFPIPRKKPAKSGCWLQPLLPGPRFVEKSPKKRKTKKDRGKKTILENGLRTYIPILYHMRNRHLLKVLVHLKSLMLLPVDGGTSRIPIIEVSTYFFCFSPFLFHRGDHAMRCGHGLLGPSRTNLHGGGSWQLTENSTATEP